MNRHYRPLSPVSRTHLRTLIEQGRQAKHPSKSSLSTGYFGLMFIFPDARERWFANSLLHMDEERRRQGIMPKRSGIKSHHFVQWQPMGSPAAVWVHTPCTPPCSVHTHILTRAVLLEHGKKPAKDIWGDKLLEAVEELALVTQLLGWEAFPCYLKLQTGCQGRVLAWFLLL